MADVEKHLLETQESPPCGPNLEHDLSFFELEEAARGKPEQQIGDSVRPGEDPKWPRVVELGQELLGRSKDLRIAVLLTRGLIRTEGVTGLASGLGLIHGLLERYWEQVYPRLDAEAADDPTERLNALAPLADPESVLRDLRDAHLASSREHGQLQVRDVEIALGRLARPQGAGAAAPRPLDQVHAQLASAFSTERVVPDALARARARAAAIQTLVGDRVGGAYGIELKPLLQTLDSVIEACDTALGSPNGTGAREAPAREEDGAGGGGRAALSTGEIRSRDDALRALDLVCSYLERHEPSNPAPLFIRRAQRLMRKNFVDIVRDLLPDSLSQLERLAGELEQP